MWSKLEKYKMSKTSYSTKILYVLHMQNFIVTINPLFAADNESLNL